MIYNVGDKVRFKGYKPLFTVIKIEEVNPYKPNSDKYYYIHSPEQFFPFRKDGSVATTEGYLTLDKGYILEGVL